jgi:hypothetical protein
VGFEVGTEDESDSEHPQVGGIDLRFQAVRFDGAESMKNSTPRSDIGRMPATLTGAGLVARALNVNTVFVHARRAIRTNSYCRGCGCPAVHSIAGH